MPLAEDELLEAELLLDDELAVDDEDEDVATLVVLDPPPPPPPHAAVKLDPKATVPSIAIARRRESD
ncbi:hypothetical protein EM6_0644 [Asticcacaulis excentricus]|uniref:Uncharacterized protein n=1 Tax=Asticcacaulis excentricus TaxID=78587 RepID=A0A3G9G0C3_9CAUL|nr:hypothetical protein EM6_0644 [Asticcacaulis excentricus]